MSPPATEFARQLEARVFAERSLTSNTQAGGSCLVWHLPLLCSCLSQCNAQIGELGRSQPMTQRRALVVEVDAATQLGVLSFLRARGFHCVAVSSPEEAQEALTDGSFSFTLVDLSGNGTDASELMECLKLCGRNSGPIIAVSSRHDDMFAMAAFDVDAILHKTLNQDELQ